MTTRILPKHPVFFINEEYDCCWRELRQCWEVNHQPEPFGALEKEEAGDHPYLQPTGNSA